MIELLFEFVLQFGLEIFGDVLAHVLTENRRARHSVLAFLAYAVAGATVGYLTVLLFPSHFIDAEGARLANLLVTPALIAALMSWVGRFRSKRDLRVVRLEHFIYAYAFAFGLALVRFFVAA